MTRRPTAGELLDGPRGRRLCLEVAGALDPAVHSWTWRAEQDATAPPGLARLLWTVDAGAVADLRDPLDLVWQMADAVVAAMYWQPPDTVDAVLSRDPAVSAALQGVATALLEAPATGWWSSPIDLERQHQLAWDPDRYGGLRPTGGARARLRSWTPEKDWQSWSSDPSDADLLRTTRALPGLGCAELMWAEDCGGDFDTAETRALTCRRPPRVYEVDGPAAWVALVERHPLDVTGSRRRDWSQVTGHRGSWWLPDWPRVATSYDAVHLTVTGYLTTATRALDVDPQRPGADTTAAATLLGGWNPDETLWLGDDILSPGEPQRWVDDGRPDEERLDARPRWRPRLG